MKLLRALVLPLVMCGLAQPAVAAVHGPAAFFRKLDRQLCADFRGLNCRRKHPNHVVPKTKIEKPPSPPAPIAPPPIPKPTLKPEALQQTEVPAQLPPAPPVQIEPAPPVRVEPAPPIVVAAPPTSDPTCIAALKAKGVDVASVAQPPGEPSCVVIDPVQLKSILVNGAVLQLPDHPILNCVFANHFVDWMQDLGGPTAAATEGSILTQFYTGPGYQCRGRNGDASAKISEHGYGNAVDVERMKFSDGKTFLVHDAPDTTSPAYETLKAIRASACTRFTTVLGPGSNDAHREHFHFDSGVHGKSGTYKICE